MFIFPSNDLSMKLSLSEVFVSKIIVTMVISNKSCCKHVLFTNLSDCISTTTRVTSVKSKKFLFCSFSVAKFGIAPVRVTVMTMATMMTKTIMITFVFVRKLEVVQKQVRGSMISYNLQLACVRKMEVI